MFNNLNYLRHFPNKIIRFSYSFAYAKRAIGNWYENLIDLIGKLYNYLIFKHNNYNKMFDRLIGDTGPGHGLWQFLN